MRHDRMCIQMNIIFNIRCKGINNRMSVEGIVRLKKQQVILKMPSFTAAVRLL